MDFTNKIKSLHNLYIKIKVALSDSGINEDIIKGRGGANSKFAVICDVPSVTDDNELDDSKEIKRLLCRLDIDRADVYVTGAVKFRPKTISNKTGKPVGRPPSKSEVELCAPFLFEELKIINPAMAITLGSVPLAAVTGDSTVKLKDFHGMLLEISNLIICPLYEPKAALYIKEFEQIFERDLDNLKKALSQIK